MNFLNVLVPVLQSTQSTTTATTGAQSTDATNNSTGSTTSTNETLTTTTTTTNQTSTAPAPGSVEASLLAGQPPGTVIKCVTAQVIQTTQGPRIVLQGLQGADFTPQQLVMVQQQVKQQLLKGSYTCHICI